MKKVVLVFIFLLIPFAFAADNVSYKIYQKNVLVEYQHQNDTMIKLPFDYSAVDSTTKYFIQDEYLYAYGEGTLKYITKSFVEGKRDKFFVVSKKENIGSDVEVQLPEGSILSSKYFAYPKGYQLKTDGQTITLEWKNMSQKDIFVPFENKKNDLILYIIISIIFIFIILYYFYGKEKKKDKFTRNLLKSEKRIMEILLGKKDSSAWTKELIRESGLSKVKLSRTLRKLEEKALIEKMPHGNENLIKIKK